jgi:hypothetical protein
MRCPPNKATMILHLLRDTVVLSNQMRSGPYHVRVYRTGK